jgi:riboflavin biosynthesis pyrimidine reductase
VLSEGGPALLSAALAAGVVDELDLSIAPALVGGPDRLVADVLTDVVRPRLVQVLEEDGVLFTRYAVG